MTTWLIPPRLTALALVLLAMLACETQPGAPTDTATPAAASGEATPGLDQVQTDPSLRPPSGALESEWRALVALYNATSGPQWRNNENWLTGEPIHSWHGVTTSDGRVTVITLPGNGLTGELPPELGDLSGLQELYLGANQLIGKIPTELGNLTSLIALDLRRNQLTGEIPPELANLKSLQGLDVAFNQLTGCVPEGLEGFNFGGLPPCGAPLAASAPTPAALKDAGLSATPAPTPAALKDAGLSATPAPTPAALKDAGLSATPAPTPAASKDAGPSAAGFGQTPDERRVLFLLRYIETYSPDAAPVVLDLPWLADGITKDEVRALEIIATSVGTNDALDQVFLDSLVTRAFRVGSAA